MASVYRQRKVQVFRIDGSDTQIILDRSCTICSVHDSLNIGSTIAAVGYINRNFCTVHGSKPSSPVGLTATETEIGVSIISGTPTIVVSTDNSIFYSRISFAKNYYILFQLPAKLL